MLTGWAASPARFREDANAEDDLALGGYRDRLVVELAQNASDAGGPRLSLQLSGNVLSAANTGAPLTDEGVAGLATLRASGKRSGLTVGRFGVGFAAVGAVADEVVIASTSGSVLFSRERTLDAVAALPELADELDRRQGRVPLLRLPFDSSRSPREGYDTEVLMPVRPESLGRVRDMLAAIDPTLLLTLPGLTEIEVGDRLLTVTPDGDHVLLDGVRWRVLSCTGEFDPALLRDRPVEEQARSAWTVTWAVPQGPFPSAVARVFRAPTATDDPLSLPAVLAASLPLGPDRRRVLPGPATDAVLEHAADVLAELVTDLPFEPDLLALVPPVLAAGELDARLGSLVLSALAPTFRDRVVLEGSNPQLHELLADVLAGLLPHPWSGSGWAVPLRRLGATRLTLAELTEALAGLERPPSWWGRLYAALPPDTDQLGALPVPLIDGSLAPSPRGLLLADSVLSLGPLGFRVVHPEARHDLLQRLGAQPAEPRTLLEDPRVRAAVEDGWEGITEPVLALVGAADLRPGELPWLAELLLPDRDGDERPAGELLLPGSPLAEVMDLEAGFGLVAEGLAHPDVLAAVGVLRDVVPVPAEEAGDVEGLETWLSSLPPGTEPGPVVADLDLITPQAWPRALELLEPHLTPYVVWWLARHPVLDGQRPDRLRTRGSAVALEGLLDVSDHPLAARIGAVSTLDEVDPELLLQRLADPAREVSREQVRVLHAHLAGRDVPLPEAVRAVFDGVVRVVPADDAVVVDRPDLLPLVSPYAVVPVPLDRAHALAETLDLALASEVVPPLVLSGEPTAWLEAEGGWVEHDRLLATTAGGETLTVDWVCAGQVDHVVGPAGKAKALAWRLGDWPRRHALLARFRGAAGEAEADLDPV